MGVDFSKNAYGGTAPRFYGDPKILPGDFKVKQTLTEGVLIQKATPLQIDFANKEVGIVKIAKVVAGGSTSAPRVAKTDHLFAVGDVLMKIGKTDASPAITAIDKTNTSYDVLTLSAAIEGLTADDLLTEATAYEAAGAATEEVKGVYTLTIGTKPAADDKLSLDGVEYLFAAAEGDAVFAIGADAKAAAANIEDAVSAQYDGMFTVVAKNGKLIFTQLVGGVGDLPVLVVTPVAETGTLAATITQTTEDVAYVPGVATPAAAKYAPNAVTGEPKVYKADGFQTVNVAYEALVIAQNTIHDPAWLVAGMCLGANHSIKFIKQ